MFGFTLLVAAAVVTPVTGSSNSSTTARLSASPESVLNLPAFRRMHAKSDKFNQEGWLDAWTELDGGRFLYTIVSERGSDTIRNKVLKAVLKREQELVAEGIDKAALTDANYVFDDAGEQGPERYVMLKPNGRTSCWWTAAWSFRRTAEILRVEGRLAKNPSFWTSLVNIIRHFAKIDGVRVPVATETVAKIKFAAVAARRGLRIRIDQRPPGKLGSTPHARLDLVRVLTDRG